MFQLQLITEDTTKSVLISETPISGTQLIHTAESCLHRYIPENIITEHQILGTLPTYAITVPYQMAITSGKFTNTDNYLLTVDENVLKDYLFYLARIDYLSGKTLCYPYYNDKLVIISRIDEIKFLTDWVASSYSNPFVKP